MKWLRYLTEWGWHPLLLGQRLWTFFRLFYFRVSVVPVKHSFTELVITSTFSSVVNVFLSIFPFKRKQENIKIMRGPWLEGKTERFVVFSCKEWQISEDVKCVLVCKNPSQGGMEWAVLYLYKRSNNGLITALLRSDFSELRIVKLWKRLRGECVAPPSSKVYKNRLEMHMSVMTHLE